MSDPIRMTWPMYRHCECRYMERIVRLTRSETEVLSVLLLHRGRPLFAGQLLEALYPDPDEEPDTAKKCLHVFLSDLRAKLPGLITYRGAARGRGFLGWTIELPREDLRQAA
jgi:DNA-binding response OmpR family regulator